MNILCGTIAPNQGTFSINNNLIKNYTPSASASAGIGMIHQHPHGAGSLKTIENIIIGYEPKKWIFFTDYKKAEKKIGEIQEEYNLPLELDTYVSELNSAQIQRMEIIHLLYKGNNVIFFDEPTASLSDNQIEDFFNLVTKLRNEDKIIIFISHKLNEIFSIADRIAVMRKGKVVFQGMIKEVSQEKIALEMIGETEEINYPFRNKITSLTYADKLYSIIDISYKKSDSEYLEKVNLDIYRGEILGIAGIRENGLELLEDIISGMKHPDKGELIYNNINVTNFPPAKLREKGISYVPTDRLNRGISRDSTIAENLILLNYKRMHKMGILAPTTIKRWVRNIQKNDKIEGLPFQKIKQLSGGNIQKVILSRELRENPDLIIICEPSWGLDFRSRNRLHKELSQTAKRGTSILLISSDIDEIIALSDRIAVLYNGKINVCRNKNELNRTTIGEYMLGIRRTSEEI